MKNERGKRQDNTPRKRNWRCLQQKHSISKDESGANENDDIENKDNSKSQIFPSLFAARGVGGGGGGREEEPGEREHQHLFPFHRVCCAPIGLISHQVFCELVCKSQFPHKFVNFIQVIVQDKLTDLW